MWIEILNWILIQKKKLNERSKNKIKRNFRFWGSAAKILNIYCYVVRVFPAEYAFAHSFSIVVTVKMGETMEKKWGSQMPFFYPPWKKKIECKTMKK